MKKIIYVILVLLFTHGCSDFLEEDPKTVLTPGGFYLTQKGMESLVQACYSFSKYQASGGSLNMINLNDNGTDIGMNGGNNLTFDGYQLNSSAGQLKGLWDNNYKAINACNNVTKFIADVEGMNDELKSIREAEARFLRAYYYYQLVMQFGPVHLSLEATEGVETEANRTPVDQIFDVMLDDLDFAVSNLPESQSTYGRLDVYAAKHFLSRVLLSDVRSGKTEFQRAAQLAKDVINNSGRALEPTRARVFDENNEKNKEIIWSVQFPEDESLADNNGNQMHLHYISRYELGVPGIIRSLEYGRPWIVNRPTPFLLDLYDETIDSRYSAYIKNVWLANVDAPEKGIYVGDTALYYPKHPMTREHIDSKKYKVYNPEGSENLGSGYFRAGPSFYPSIIKFIDSKRASINDMRGSRNWVVFRLAETYLLASEAFYKADDMDNAVFYMNILRRAAALPGKESEMEISASELDIDFILDERGRELCGELWRWIDLKRTGKLLERVRAHNPSAANRMKDYHVLRPIPQSQIDRTSNDYPQNDGYE
jgi:starch-binding outer membrane protein, SusD/RagB family